jgi:hypothetical protein
MNAVRAAATELDPLTDRNLLNTVRRSGATPLFSSKLRAQQAPRQRSSSHRSCDELAALTLIWNKPHNAAVQRPRAAV